MRATTTTTKKKQQQQLANQIGLNCGHKMMNNVSQSLAQFRGIVGRTPTSVPLQEIPIQALYSDYTINTMGTQLVLHLIVP